jgi:hypothetical protein
LPLPVSRGRVDGFAALQNATFCPLWFPACLLGNPLGPAGGGFTLREVRARSLRVMQSRRMGGAKRYPSMPAQKVMGFAALYPSYDRHTSRSRGVIHPRFACSFAPFEIEGAGKTGCLLHPRSRVRFAQTNGHTSIQGSWKHSGLPCAMALRLTSSSPRRTALLPPSSVGHFPNLAPAPRRPNHTTSPYAQAAHVSRSSRVHRISPRVRDDGQRPSSAETSGVMRVICVTAEAEYFCAKGWTDFW